MRLIQLNVWRGQLKNNILKFIKEQTPDIFCVQELCSSPSGESAFFDNLEDIQKSMNYPHISFEPNFDFQFMGKTIFFGNAVFSNFSITQKWNRYTNLSYKSNFEYEKDDYNIRTVQYAEVSTPSGKLNILNHHGFHVPSSKMGNAETDRQMDLVLQWYKEMQGPTVLCGDFNLLPESSSLKKLNAEMKNLCVAHNVTNTRNFLAKSYPHVCDYIFVNDGIGVNSFTVSEEVISDHAALVLDFDVVKSQS